MRPLIYVVMGVSGVGKTTIGAAFAQAIGAAFADADEFHSPANIAKMHAGVALDDADRAPWLAAIAAWIDARLAAGERGVVTCSALKRRYRDAIIGARPRVRLVYLRGEEAMVAGRLSNRHGHFMPAALLHSQFTALEAPSPDENASVVDASQGPDVILAALCAQAQ